MTRREKAALLQARFDAQGNAIGGVKVEDVAGLDALPAAAAVAFHPSGEAAWAALLPSGAVASSASPGPTRVSGAVLVPMQIYASDQKLYVVIQPAGTARALNPQL